jgi:hypothetical protein
MTCVACGLTLTYPSHTTLLTGVSPNLHGIGGNLYLPFIQAGLVTLKDGEVTDWQAMPWNDRGSAAIMLRDTADAAIKAKVADLLKQIQADSQYGIAYPLDYDELVAHGGTAQASWFLQFGLGYEMGLKPGVPILSPDHYRGMHGYDAALPEMCSTFLIAGKGVLAGKSLGSIEMHDIDRPWPCCLTCSSHKRRARPYWAKQCRRYSSGKTYPQT